MKKNLRAARLSVAYERAFIRRDEIKNDRQKALVRDMWESLASRSGRAEMKRLFVEQLNAPKLNREAAQVALKHIEYLDLIGACGSA